MGKLVFKYGTMSSGKSLQLLTFAHQLKNNCISYQIMKPSIDTRTINTIKSRIGIEEECTLIGDAENVIMKIDLNAKWILIDESQFLTKSQVDELAYIVDNYNINIVCYGLRTDSNTYLFEGSKRLFEISDEIEEIVSYCTCGNRNCFNAKINSDGKIDMTQKNGQIDIGGDEKYKSMCRKCHFLKIFDSTEYAEEL